MNEEAIPSDTIFFMCATRLKNGFKTIYRKMRLALFSISMFVDECSLVFVHQELSMQTNVFFITHETLGFITSEN